jgi:predicted DNA-binding helix-hairpin-helix protein
MIDSIARLKLLSEQMHLEPAEDQNSFGTANQENSKYCADSVFIHPAVLPNGRKIKLLKTLLSSACERDCYYCPFRAGRDVRRATFQPEEFSRLFIMLAQKGIAEGVFLSSGMVGGGIHTEDKLIDTADILRHKLNFRGYIHLKIMPGSEYEQVKRAMQLADRVSINLEAPNTERLARLAPHKQFFEELLEPIKWMNDIRLNLPVHLGWKGRWPSSVTQFVAGGAGESDLELLAITQSLYRDFGLRRAYYSRFDPIPGTPMENHVPIAPIREYRLYQASFLLRDYGFELLDLAFEDGGNLLTKIDPKMAWAQRNLVEQPIEINNADRQTLLRIPGIGLKSADSILRVRYQRKINDLSSLRKLGILTARAAPYLLVNGRRAAFQPILF